MKVPDRRVAAALLLSCALASCLLHPGCGARVSPEIEKLMGEAQSHYEKQIEAVKGLQTFQRQWDGLLSAQEITAEAIAKGKGLVTAARDDCNTALDENNEIEIVLRRAARLDMSREMKTYIEMRIDAVKEQETLLKLYLEGIDLRAGILADLELNAPIEKLLEDSAKIAENNQESARQANKVKALQQDARDFSKEKRLGL